MTIEEYKDLLLEDELKIGYDLSEEYEEYEEEEESYIDGLKTSGFIPVEDDELFGEPIYEDLKASMDLQCHRLYMTVG